MLIDDNDDDNFFHERTIKKFDDTIQIVIKNDGLQAINYLKEKSECNALPDLIFLDLNMPVMNGWGFLDEYEKLSADFQAKVVVVMLTTSENPDDMKMAMKNEVNSDFKTKPLTVSMLEEILNEYLK